MSLDNLLGKKDLSKTLNEVGYKSTTDSPNGIYRGQFKFIDDVEEEKLVVYYTYTYPKSEDTIKNKVKVSVEFKKVNPVFMFIKSTDVKTLEIEHEIEFPNS